MILTNFTDTDYKTVVKLINFLAEIQEYRQVKDPSVMPIKQLSSHVRYLYSTRDFINEIIFSTASFFKKENEKELQEVPYDRFLSTCKIITNFADTARLMKDLKWTSWSQSFYRRLAFVSGIALMILFGKESVENIRQLQAWSNNKSIDRQKCLLKLIKSSSRCYLGATLIRHSITLEKYPGDMILASAGETLPSCILLFKEKMNLRDLNKS